MCKDLVSVVPRVQHDDSCTVVFIDHSPQINDGVRQRHLCHDERTATTIALSQTHTHADTQLIT